MSQIYLKRYLAALILQACFVNLASSIPIGNDEKPTKSHNHATPSKPNIHGAWVLQQTSDGLQGILFINKSAQGLTATFNGTRGNENAEERCQIDESGSTLNLVCSISRSTNGWIADSFMLEIDGAHLKGQIVSGSHQQDALLVRNDEDKKIKEDKSRAEAEAKAVALAKAEEKAKEDATRKAENEARYIAAERERKIAKENRDRPILEKLIGHWTLDGTITDSDGGITKEVGTIDIGRYESHWRVS